MFRLRYEFDVWVNGETVDFITYMTTMSFTTWSDDQIRLHKALKHAVEYL